MKKKLSYLACLFASMFLITSCSNKNSNEETSDKEILVESVSFDFLSDSTYVGGKIYLTNLEILPMDATNKTLTWSIENPTLASIDRDVISTKAEGNTFVICQTTDGSNIEFKKEIHIEPLLTPDDIIVPGKQCVYVGKTIELDVSFAPNSLLVNKNYHVEVDSVYSDILEVTDGKKILTKKPGDAVVKVVSDSNPLLVKDVEIRVEDDLLSYYQFSEPSNNYRKVFSYEDRYSLVDFECDITADPGYNGDKYDSWPAFTLVLPEPVNLSRAKLSLEIKNLTGITWFSIKTLGAKRNPIHEYAPSEMGGDAVRGEWVTRTILPNAAYNKDVYFIQFNINTGRRATVPISDMTVHFMFDNLTIEEKPIEAISLITNEIDIDLVHNYIVEQSKVIYTPEDTTMKGFTLFVKEGYEDYIEINDNKIKGKQVGTGYIILSSSADPSVYQEIKCNIVEYIKHLEAIYVSKGHALSPTSFGFSINIQENIDKKFYFEFKPEGDGKFGFTFGDHADNKWVSPIPNVLFEKNGSVVTCNQGIVLESVEDGWYTWCYNFSDIDLTREANVTDINAIESNWNASLNTYDPITLDGLWVDIETARAE